jgi:hypothetical protein
MQANKTTGLPFQTCGEIRPMGPDKQSLDDSDWARVSSMMSSIEEWLAKSDFNILRRHRE